MTTTETITFILRVITLTIAGLFAIDFLRSMVEEIRQQRIDKILREEERDAWRRRL